MTQTNRNRLFAILLAIIPVASYCYFLFDFISDEPNAESDDDSKKHRYRIGQEHSATLELNKVDQ